MEPNEPTKTTKMESRPQVFVADQAFNPDMLRLARDYNQMKRNRLAELAGVSASFITQIEDGIKQPSESTVAKLEEHLRFPREFFYQNHRFEGAPTSLFRRRVTITKTVMAGCTAKLALAKLALLKLLSELEAPELKLVQLDPDEVTGGPVAIARLTRRSLRIPPGPIRNLVDILEEAGVLVIPFDFGTSKIDGCSDWVGDRPVIFYNPAIPRSRLRFTLAHELGHLVMHTIIDEGPCEDQADAFAAEFNLPADEIRHQILPMSLKKLASLKLHWKSSMASILYRARELNLVSEYKHRHLVIMMRQMQYHLEEPHEDLIPFERPHSLDHLIQAYTNYMGFDRETLLRDLRLSEPIFTQILPSGQMLRAV